MTTATSRETLFRETQRFPYWVLAIPTGVVFLDLLVIFFDDARLANMLVFISIAGSIVLLLATARLETEVREDGLYIRFFPFHWTFKWFAFSDIASATARRYSPLGEYGGWGIRYGFFGKGKAYNVRGNEGVQLVFKDGQKLLIGSQCAEELAALIQSKLALR